MVSGLSYLVKTTGRTKHMQYVNVLNAFSIRRKNDGWHLDQMPTL